jgi:hypothetical protein
VVWLLLACARTPEDTVRTPGDDTDTGEEPRARAVVVSHPYDADGNGANVFELLELSAEGELSRTDTFFELGRASFGEITFTPDGRYGLVPQEDGTVGVFAVDGPAVIEAAWDSGQYVSEIVVDPDGRIFGLDGNWRENGGGVYEIAIAEDGSPSVVGQVVPSKLPAALLFDGDRAVLVAKDAFDSAEGDEAHLLDWSGPDLLDSAALFPDEDAIVSTATLTPDGEIYAGDYSSFSGVPNRVSVARIEGDTITPVTVVSPVEDPIDLVASPFGGAVLVVSGYGDALFALSTDDHELTELSYTGGRPALPARAVLVGDLALVAENTGVRRVRFTEQGIEDLGAFGFGGDLDDIVGVIGVQP